MANSENKELMDGQIGNINPIQKSNDMESMIFDGKIDGKIYAFRYTGKNILQVFLNGLKIYEANCGRIPVSESSAQILFDKFCEKGLKDALKNVETYQKEEEERKKRQAKEKEKKKKKY